MSIVTGVLLGTLAETTPLLYTSLGETVAQRAGVINVGLEGILLASAFTASLTTYHIGNPYIGVGIGMLTGVVFALLFGFFALVLHADQVVTGVVFNLFALGITGTLYRFLFALHDKSLITAQLPLLHHSVTLLTPLALPAVALVWWWLYSTRSGLELRACGEQPLAADAAGISVRRRALLLLFLMERWQALPALFFPLPTPTPLCRICRQGRVLSPSPLLQQAAGTLSDAL